MEDSLEHLEQIRDVYAAAPKLASPSRLNAERTIEALDYLRIGEVENCLSLHGPDACIFPFRPGAYHKKQRGSREAIRRLEQILRNNTNDLSSRWLMNLAYTTLGEYPDGVPPQYLIAPKYFESEYDIKRFTNIANPLGLEVFDLAPECVLLLHAERVKLRLLQPSDCARILYTQTPQGRVARTIHVN